MKLQTKIILTTILLLCLAGGGVFLFNWRRDSRQETGSVDKINIQATIYPIAELSRQIGKDFVSINTITPIGQEAHDYEPTARQLKQITDEADIFIYNGAGIDPWAKDLTSKMSKANAVALNLSQKVELLKASGEEHADEEEKPEEVHSDSEYDPHFWLDPVLVKEQVRAISELLQQKYPERSNDFKMNQQNFESELDKLDQDYKQQLSQCQVRKIVTSHSAFQYLGKRYNFEIVPIAGISPDNEPSTQDLSQISSTAKDSGVKYVFFESLSNPKLSQTIARETGAELLELNPIENLTSDQKLSDENYVNLMRQNLTNLKTAMQCR
ncbi:MAG: metal ABC transporter substrate-binding protein [Patescibacteria group bacterium]